MYEYVRDTVIESLHGKESAQKDRGINHATVAAWLIRIGTDEIAKLAVAPVSSKDTQRKLEAQR